MSRLISGVVFVAVLALVVVSGLGLGIDPLAVEQYWILHALAFAALMFSARLAFPRTLLFWTFVYGVLLAVLVELLQGLLPRQELSPLHLAANIAGVIVGLLVAKLWKHFAIIREDLRDR